MSNQMNIYICAFNPAVESGFNYSFGLAESETACKEIYPDAKHLRTFLLIENARSMKDIHTREHNEGREEWEEENRKFAKTLLPSDYQ